ncbi:NlpC/P60 family protein [Burkholderia pseudomallei]|uniref:NlpC/P60 family protein n=1 Tax=Burkholderia pseudomallei TaxID=28450 RepID=UPI000A19FE1E|nr:NlpC/P60 family protein [Burkholderia pseudomallei]ARK56313.1 peptidase P60 [Burkholderia pseudomallei]ARL25497.1 peptidase P60 [Burkholderia pseudomallei]ARL77609.1 peptidase P60 [Burkholderia pseudomallei]ARL84215.1 peptidase P60 [Burkholderia pseudomallei]
MSVTREQFVAEARSWLDTPYQHQGRLKGVGVDCIGLLACVAHALDLSDADFTDYERRPDGRLRPVLETHLERVPLDEAQGADVLLFAWSSTPIHIAIMTDATHIIHAYIPNRRVVESRLDEAMRVRVVAAYHVPGVE